MALRGRGVSADGKVWLEGRLGGTAAASEEKFFLSESNIGII